MTRVSLSPVHLLRFPLLYKLFQDVIGANAFRRRVIEEFSPCRPTTRVLEVGCGPGTNVEFLPDGVEYIGCDLSADYIAFARKRYSARGRFVHADVSQLPSLQIKGFDYVWAIALLHHLDDRQVHQLCLDAKEVLAPGGVFITADPCYSADQPAIERWITSKDRGRFVRTPDQYARLLERVFPGPDAFKVRGSLLAPHSTCVVRAVRGPLRDDEAVDERRA